jgi:homoserine kinase
VRVRVPATSANLGPGFDACGLALGLYDDVVVRVADAGLRVDIAGEGAETLKRTERNLVVIALRAAFDALGGQPRGLEIVCANRVPQSRGLGSSAAAVVAGVLAARELVLGGMDDDRVLGVATAVEGHPDNVAAALRGGFTVAWTGDDGGARVLSLPVSAALSPVAFVPSGARVSTSKARASLPETVPHADAARTAGRAALLAAALADRPELLLDATADWLHQPYRLAAQPRGEALLARLRDDGHAAVLSGSGPSIVALCPSPQAAASAAALAGRGWDAVALPVDRAGAQVLPVAGDAAGRVTVPVG